MQSFLLATSDAEAQRQLDRLVADHILPIIAGVLSHKMRGPAGSTARHSQHEEERSDLRNDILAQVLDRLQSARTQPDSTAITDLEGYVAVVSYNAFRAHLRQKYPQRFSLENKLRYLLGHRQGLALWQVAPAEWTAGFAAWEPQRAGNSNKLQQALDDPETIRREAQTGESAKHMNPADLLDTIFRWTGHPITLDDMIRITSVLWGIQEARIEPQAEDDLHSDSRKPLPHETEDSLGTSIIGQLDMRRYWQEICQLPPKQCAALLLQAHDPNGNCLIELLVMERIADLREVAQMIDLPAETLATLWNDLPLKDARIAEHLGITTQHVSRLRMDARRCLLKRIKPFS